jgi:hypothetical protein
MLAAGHQEENVKKLRIAEDLALPLQIVTARVGILGETGSGKTTTASVLVEQLLAANLPTSIIDPTDAWWGLKSSKNGKAEGFPVTVLGGDHGDVPLEETAGAVIADLVAAEAPPLVLSLSHFTKAAMRRFLADFAERLFLKNRRALHLVWDEADEAAPQNPMKMKGGGERLFGAIDTIVRRGRIRGLGVTMISQRSAEISKSILSQCAVLVAHRASHPTDVDPVLDWMKHHAKARLAEVASTIAELQDGEAWVMSPKLLRVFDRYQIRDRETFNSSATPEPGEEPVVPKRLAKPDLAVLQEKMRDTIERAKANDPAALRRALAEKDRRLADLESSVRRLAVAPPAKEKRVEVPVLKDAQIARLEKAANQAEHAADVCQRIADGIRLDLARAHAPPLVAAPRPAAPIPPARRLIAAAPAPRAAPGRRPADGEPSLRRGERLILEVLARSRPARRSRAQLGTLAGFTPSGGTFGTYWGVLKRYGFVEEGRDGLASITDAGLAAIGEAADAPPQTREEVIETWRRALRAGERAMLDALLAAPAGLSREQLGAQTGFAASGGTFGTYLGVLRRNGLAEVDGDLVRPGDAILSVE